MATRYSEFHFSVNGLLVLPESLGATVVFIRSGYQVEIQLPRDAWTFYRATKFWATETNAGGGTRVNVIQVRVFDCAPLSGDLSDEPDEGVEDRIGFLQRSYSLADGVCADFVEWARLRAQPWLGLHGHRPKRTGFPVVCDEHAEYSFDDDVLPSGDPLQNEYPVEAAIDSIGIASFAVLLADPSRSSSRHGRFLVF
jgi:hypothetical protein